ncbi:hypothetical protein L3Q82_010344 [Scortum barcoo]|uniref:Uncharacterized protein n=1 Tax=Scortum barcoo TaxID=214431 RepID=A0ACB8WBN3_9TELE|nr:hypothetical protein L3Q82_010344 [Scortum barcoo]
MSERSGASTLATMTLEEPGAEQASPRAPGPLRCGPCAVWPRQQTWLCAVPLVMGFVGLGLSLMLLKWIVVGSVQDYVPTDLVDPKGSIGQDPIFLSKPSAMPKGPDISTATTTSAASTTALVSTTTPLAADGTAPAPRTRSGPPANHSANGSTANGDGNRAPHLHNHVGTRISGTVVTSSTTRATRLTPPPSSKEVTPRSTVRKGSGAGNGRNGAANSKPGQTSATITTTASTTTTATVKTIAKHSTANHLPASGPGQAHITLESWARQGPGHAPTPPLPNTHCLQPIAAISENLSTVPHIPLPHKHLNGHYERRGGEPALAWREGGESFGVDSFIFNTPAAAARSDTAILTAPLPPQPYLALLLEINLVRPLKELSSAESGNMGGYSAELLEVSKNQQKTGCNRNTMLRGRDALRAAGQERGGEQEVCPRKTIRAAVAPTLPSLRSEVFKPCVEDKDLAFCLNEGECSIIETVAGVHRHCSSTEFRQFWDGESGIKPPLKPLPKGKACPCAREFFLPGLKEYTIQGGERCDFKEKGEGKITGKVNPEKWKQHQQCRDIYLMMKANISTVPGLCLYECSNYGSFPSTVDLASSAPRQVLSIPVPHFLPLGPGIPVSHVLSKCSGLNCILSSAESGDTYQRQVLSIFSIASGICLLGVACMALYRRNKRHREKLQAHFSDTRSLRDCSVNASGLMSKSTPRLQYSLQLQKSCSSHGSCIKGNSVVPGTSTVTPPILSRALSKGKRFRSSSLSLSPAQQRRETNYFRTPPVSRGKHKITTNLIDGSRVAGPVYKHLQEDESTDIESIRRCDSAGGRVGALLSRTSLSHFAARKGWTEVPCTRLDKGTAFLPPSLRTRSVPIIPSLQACDLEAGNVDTSDRNQGGLLKLHPALKEKTAMPISNSPSPPCETVVQAPGVMPGSVSTPAATTVMLGSEKNLSSAQTPCSFEITVELAQDLKQKSLSIPVKMSRSHGEIHRGGTNTLEAGTARESEGKSVRDSARVLHTGSGTRGLKAAGQREAQGQCQGQTSLAYGGANCFLATKGPSCRGMGNAFAKPPAS